MKVLGAVIAVAVAVSSAGVASAFECFNASKNGNNPGAGAQVVLDPNDEIFSATNGLMKRVEKGIVDPDTGEGYHGVLAFADENGDIIGSTYIVTPQDEIPLQAQFNGSPDHGIINICDSVLDPC
jgi:hypothetical protein